MKTFDEYLIEQGFLRGLVGGIKNAFQPKSDQKTPTPPPPPSWSVPKSGDALKIVYLYKSNGMNLISQIHQGKLIIQKDGSLFFKSDDNSSFKIADNIQQAQLTSCADPRTGLACWQIKKHLD